MVHDNEQNDQFDAAQSQPDDSNSALEAALESDFQETSAEQSLGSKLQECEREVLRARAELENFRKRMQRDSDQQLKYANVPLVRDLIEVVDNLNRAMSAAEQDATHATALRDGVGMVQNQLSSILAKYGCKPIESVGKEFDPNFHEAIAQIPSQEFAAGVVAQEVAVGYMLHDRVVRPSSVIVSTGAPAN